MKGATGASEPGWTLAHNGGVGPSVRATYNAALMRCRSCRHRAALDGQATSRV
jgi:hypothetical protein